MSSLFIDRASRGSPTLHFVEGPASGPPLLLLHGVTRNWRDWEPLLPELTHDWRVFALDHRGHGASGRVSGSYLVADYARDAAAFVRATFSEPVTVFGHSLGAMVTLALAAECSECVAGVVLEDPPFDTMGNAIAATPYRAQFVGMQSVARHGGNLETMTDALAEIRLPGPGGEVRFGSIRDRDTLRFSAECLADLDPDVFTPLIAGDWLDGFDHATLWPRVRCPVLLLQGDPAAGGALSNADAELAERTLSACQRAHFPSVGHQIHRTSPAHVGTVFRRWVRDFSLR